jgi:S-formylglutathione hydrolase FrmB
LSAGTGPLTLQDAKGYVSRTTPGLPDSSIEKYYKRQSVVELVKNWPDSIKKSVRWYIDCGDDDFLFEGNSLVHIAMRKRDIPHEYRVRNGAHNWTYWRESLPEVLWFVSQGFRQF